MQPVSRQQEIFTMYGQMVNWQLLHVYGFTKQYTTKTNNRANINMVVVVRTAALRARMGQGRT